MAGETLRNRCASRSLSASPFRAAGAPFGARHKVTRFSTEVADSPYCANTISLISNSAKKNRNASEQRNVSPAILAGLQWSACGAEGEADY